MSGWSWVQFPVWLSFLFNIHCLKWHAALAGTKHGGVLNKLHCVLQTALEYSDMLQQNTTICTTVTYVATLQYTQYSSYSAYARCQRPRQHLLCIRTAMHSHVLLFSLENNGCYLQHACAYQGRCISHMCIPRQITIMVHRPCLVRKTDLIGKVSIRQIYRYFVTARDDQEWRAT